MITDDQSAIIEFLASPSTHGSSVERIDTHSAVVFMAGDRAWKLKRAVKFDYLDFSTAERRKASCEAELHLNRRTAPAIYKRVVPVTRENDGALALGGRGTPEDWVVEMQRFDQEVLFDRLATQGRLGLDLMWPLARHIARFHASAEPRRDHGGSKGMSWVVEGNAEGFAEFGSDVLPIDVGARLTEAARAEVRRHTKLLDARRDSGFVRQCHGDLHLRNIVLLDGQPTLFDAIEFNDELACTDVLYDLAFLLMDLWRRELPRHANSVWNGYLGETGSLDGLALMPLFLSCRAAVRAKTSATAARFQSEGQRVRELQELARGYLTMAERLLRPASPELIAIGGLSGSGKSVLALGLAPFVGAVPGAVVIRSDEVRKRLLGVQPQERLGADAYTPEMSARVYASAFEQAGVVLQGGHSVVVDAVFARREDRIAVERVAAETSVPFTGVWLEAPESTLIARARARHGDASDADEAVVRMQHAQETGAIDWHRVDASRPPDDVLSSVLATLGTVISKPRR